MAHVAGSLKALLSSLIDYAGLYPPASLTLSEVLENYGSYLTSQECWILNRLVLPSGRLPEIRLGENWRVTLLVDDEPGLLPPQVEVLESKGARRLSLPTYCEVPMDRISDAFAKLRTGGVTPEAILPAEQLADFLSHAAERRLPFKATAGLHHPIRSLRPLTYTPGGPCATMHGFVNVFVAAALAWHGSDRETVLAVLEESDPRAFQFDDDSVQWRAKHLSSAQIRTARRDFAHSFGSCSFEEPVSDLRELGWLP